MRAPILRAMARPCPHWLRDVGASSVCLLTDGALNWMLFKWEPERLQGDEIIRLLTHGAEQAAPHHDPTLEAHWEDFMNRAFVMLGPRRFDELKEISNLIQANEITGPDVVARSRYLMGREFEGLHSEYLKVLKKAGVKLK